MVSSLHPNQGGVGISVASRRSQIEKDDDRRIADGRVMAGEFEAAGLAIHPEDGDVVAR